MQVANPSLVPLPISAIYLCIQGVKFEPFPVSLTLAPGEVSRLVALTGIPREAGKAVARGCFVTCCGVTTEHFFRYCIVLCYITLYCTVVSCTLLQCFVLFRFRKKCSVVLRGRH